MSAANLALFYTSADEIDRREGLLAYPRYATLLRALAAKYSVSFEQVVAVFVSLSPNNDYYGNLRSTVTLLEARRRGLPFGSFNVATYRHCAARAWAYLHGEADFLTNTRGLKILSFYHNILDPANPAWVTVDGHMVAAWRGAKLTMKDALVKPAEYYAIRDAVIAAAAQQCIPPCAYQATVWFCRKRTLRIRYSPQLNLFHAADDAWQVAYPLADIPPYPIISEKTDGPIKPQHQ